ncbi:hypothetical protein D9V32_15085 [Mycetocola tolaasinivorans]|uniref:Asp23/Gls24 family envelope stress response protein n=1 Tax=Mycetocola tolaasinivorans TaxID=76635 RepID=A0A3L6ZXX5_9MICO|nr:hypothetical protein [Mycetocola tolaasinivorans]RLP72769.1 hypothetical protein D9V32_15085 [Mycetocola tolaasinivorans]
MSVSHEGLAGVEGVPVEGVPVGGIESAAEIEAQIEAAVRAVPGVSAVFPASSTASRVVEAGARLLGIRQDAPASVVLERMPAGVVVAVAIGIRASASASDTARAAHAAVYALLFGQGIEISDVRITVVHIDNGHSDAPSPDPSGPTPTK